jgi:protein SCO1/2
MPLAVRLTAVPLLVASLLTACTGRPAFQGTALDPPRDALDFTLQDQRGQRVRLRDLHGKVVVLTFLYTSCTDICPLVAAKLREANGALRDGRGDVVFLAVTVDPERDTVARMAEYSRRWGMFDHWHFLTGSARELEPVWRYYWVGEVRRAARGQAGSAADHEIQHAAPVHLIDRAGRVRVAYGSTFRPPELAHDVEILLGE